MLKLMFSPYFYVFYFLFLFFLNCPISYFFSRLHLIFNKFSYIHKKKNICMPTGDLVGVAWDRFR